MEQEKRILIRKQFEMSSNKDKKNVILYLLDMGYDNKDLTEIFGVNAKKIYNIKAAKLNQHYMEQIIGTKIYGLVAEPSPPFVLTQDFKLITGRTPSVLLTVELNRPPGLPEPPTRNI